MSEFTPFLKARMRVTQAAGEWRHLLKVVRAESQRPGYVGPSLARIEAVFDEMAETAVAIAIWEQALAGQRRRRRAVDTAMRSMSIRDRAHEIVRREPDTEAPASAKPAPSADDWYADFLRQWTSPRDTQG
jgi:hypothetical protein